MICIQGKRHIGLQLLFQSHICRPAYCTAQYVVGLCASAPSVILIKHLEKTKCTRVPDSSWPLRIKLAWRIFEAPFPLLSGIASPEITGKHVSKRRRRFVRLLKLARVEQATPHFTTVVGFTLFRMEVIAKEATRAVNRRRYDAIHRARQCLTMTENSLPSLCGNLQNKNCLQGSNDDATLTNNRIVVHIRIHQSSPYRLHE